MANKASKTTKPATTTKAKATKPEAKADAAPSPVVAAPNPKAKKEAKPQTIKLLKHDKKFGGARASWYVALLAHDGKTVEEFAAACSTTPPSVPKSGKAEDPHGWLRYFVRERVAQVA